MLIICTVKVQILVYIFKLIIYINNLGNDCGKKLISVIE